MSDNDKDTKLVKVTANLYQWQVKSIEEVRRKTPSIPTQSDVIRSAVSEYLKNKS